MRWHTLYFLFVVLLVLHDHDHDLLKKKRGRVLATTTPPLMTKRRPALPLKTAKVVLSPPPQDLLSFTHYLHTCPDAEAIIQNKVMAWVKKDYTIAASIIRLHFHDCAVRGCDASILLNHARSERRAEASKTLRGFHVIEEIKAELEKRCPKTVSCADILTAAARDATLLIGGPFWEVPFGRKDGRVSVAREANTMVPQGHENITALINFFQTRGLDILDLVVLSGSHTIGRSTCHSFQSRLGMHRRPDPSLNTTYLRALKRKCAPAHRKYVLVDLDATTPRKFDNEYFKNLEKEMGLLSTDQGLYRDSRTSPIVQALATQPDLFTNQFAVSMVKLGNLQISTGNNHGEIRRNCNFVN